MEMVSNVYTCLMKDKSELHVSSTRLDTDLPCIMLSFLPPPHLHILLKV